MSAIIHLHATVSVLTTDRQSSMLEFLAALVAACVAVAVPYTAIKPFCISTVHSWQLPASSSVLRSSVSLAHRSSVFDVCDGGPRRCALCQSQGAARRTHLYLDISVLTASTSARHDALTCAVTCGCAAPGTLYCVLATHVLSHGHIARRTRGAAACERPTLSERHGSLVHTLAGLHLLSRRRCRTLQ